MQCAKCKSTNIEKLAHYWAALPSESPLRVKYAPPHVTESRYLLVLAAVAVGILVMVSGEALLGLAVAVGGLVWGAVMFQMVASSLAGYAAWSSLQICLACTKQF